MESLFVKGNRSFRESDYDKAAEYYRESIKKNPGFPQYFVNLSAALEKLGDRHGAFEAKRAAIKIKPELAQLFSESETEVINEFFGLHQYELSNRILKAYPEADLLKARRTLDALKRKMLNLGFEETGLAKLKEQANAKNPARRLLASRELALYSLNQGTIEAAEQAKDYIDYCLKNELDEENYRKAAIMKAECLRVRGKSFLFTRFFNEVENKVGVFPDLILAKANVAKSPRARIEWINKIYDECGLARICLEGDAEEPYTNLSTPPCQPTLKPETMGSPLVTVIVPTYNAEHTLPVALRSLTEQTWKNLEILVVDDCSTDNTAQIVSDFSKQDARIRLLQAEKNGGPYVARNLALLEAKGDFITTNDADDWSHAQKIEIQVNHLCASPHILGNTSQQSRATPDLIFHRRGNYGFYNFTNMSSFMFRREVLKDVGFWDSVRFGADSEFIRRIKKVHGPACIEDLKTPPLSFQRQSADSLTGSSAFGYHGFFMGARREHFESYLHFHTNNEATYYDFPQKERPFQVPEPMRPQRSQKDSKGQREFDVVIVSDFRLDGGSTLSSIEEIKAHLAHGLTTGLVQMSRYDYPPKKKINPQIRELLQEGKVEFVVYGEKVKCQHALFRYPPILQHRQKYVPGIEAEQVSVIVNQPPMSDYGPKAELRYEMPIADRYVTELTGKKAMWRPIGPAVREALQDHHGQDLLHVEMADDDWCNIIDVDHWYRGEHMPNAVQPVIARHSRDNRHKWPDTSADLLKAYPDSDKFKVKVLGGAETPAKTLGGVPENWEVHEFGALHPREFLRDVDVYVYYTHPDWVESFGRVVLEAMAVGIPVVVPEVYKPLFGKAATYAEIAEVKGTINQLVQDPVHYRRMGEQTLNLVREKFSYGAHIARLGLE